MKGYDKKERRLLFLYLLIVIAIAGVVAFAGYQYHQNFEKDFRTNVNNQLSLIARSKVDELDHWWDERRDDAKTIFRNEVFSKYVRLYFKNPNDSLVKREIKAWMKEFKTGFDYEAVMLTDTQLIRRILISSTAVPPSAKISTNDLAALKSGQLVFMDFYESAFRQKVFLKVLLPIMDLHQLIGIVELRIDPRTYLYSILSHWPTPSESSELFILRREGNDAVYLSELKYKKNSSLNLRVPLVQTSDLAVQTVLGKVGFMEGMGYRGKKVVAYMAGIPNSPWYLVAQTDADELYAPLQNDLWQTVIFGFIIFLLGGMGLAFLWKNQRTLLDKERIQSVEALRESEERFRSLYENSTLGIYRTTPSGKIILANDTLIHMLGYESFGDLCVIELDKEEYAPDYDRKQFIERMETNGEIIGLEAQWNRKDGTPVYIRENARAIRDLNQKTLYYDGTVEDISAIRKSELERQVIYEITEGISTTGNLNELLRLIHHSLGKVLYVENIFVSLYDPSTGLFRFPYYADQFDTAPEPAEMKKSCTAYVFRTGKPLLITPEVFQRLKEENEIELVGSPSPSWIGIPLQIPARTIGILVLQHYEKENVYTERDVQFLDSVGSQIAMAIDRKQAEEDLRNERLLLRTLIDNIPDSIYCKDNAYRKTLANRTELGYLGAHSEAEILGKTDFDLFPKEMADGFLADDQLVIEQGQSVINREEFIINSSGKKQWLLTSKLPIRDEFGSITGLVGIGRDITTRRQAEEDLRESEIKLSVILQSTADGILAVDGTGKVIKTNRRFAELWSIPQALIDSEDDEALITYVLDQLTHPEEFLSKVVKLYHSKEEDLDYLHFKDGRTFERFSAPMIMSDSSVGRVWSFRDITDRKQVEQALRESEEQHRLLFETAQEGLFVYQEGYLAYFNPMIIQITGYSAEELQVIKINDLVYADDRDLVAGNYQKRLAGEEARQRYQFRIVKKDKSIRWVEFSGTTFEWKGKPATLNFINDITDQKLAQIQLVHLNEELQVSRTLLQENLSAKNIMVEELTEMKEDLSKSIAEKDKFFSIIAHDLRSPFSGFLGLTQVMAEDLPSLTMGQVQELAVTMRNSATNLYGLLENLLKWSQMQKGSISFSPEVIQLRPMVDECIAIAFAPALMKGIDLKCIIPEGLELIVDSNMFQTIIRNLVSNALKFTPQGGEVIVSAQTTAAEQVELAIHDTGIGMNQTMLDNLFRPDVRTSRKGTDGEPSTGLGLLLCKEFVEKHGGLIRVESEVGKGSVFYLTMPAIKVWV